MAREARMKVGSRVETFPSEEDYSYSSFDELSSDISHGNIEIAITIDSSGAHKVYAKDGTAGKTLVPVINAMNLPKDAASYTSFLSINPPPPGSGWVLVCYPNGYYWEKPGKKVFCGSLF